MAWNSELQAVVPVDSMNEWVWICLKKMISRYSRCKVWRLNYMYNTWRIFDRARPNLDDEQRDSPTDSCSMRMHFVFVH